MIGRIYDMEARQDLTAARLLALGGPRVGVGRDTQRTGAAGRQDQRVVGGRVAVDGDAIEAGIGRDTSSAGRKKRLRRVRQYRGDTLN